MFQRLATQSLLQSSNRQIQIWSGDLRGLQTKTSQTRVRDDLTDFQINDALDEIVTDS